MEADNSALKAPSSSVLRGHFTKFLCFLSTAFEKRVPNCGPGRHYKGNDWCSVISELS